MEKNPQEGDIVNFFPSKNPEVKLQLPNGMTSAPALVTKAHDKSCDLKISDVGDEPFEVLSIQHRSAANEESACWEWPDEEV